MLGIITILVLQDHVSVDTLLYLALDLIRLLFRSRVGPPTYLVTHKIPFRLGVQLDQLVTGGWRRQVTERLQVSPVQLL